MSKNRKKFTVLSLILLLLITAASSLLGSFAETAAYSERISEQRHSHHEQGNIAENLPCAPYAAFRFSGRQNRTAVSSSRTRPWTPTDFHDPGELLNIKKFTPSVPFDLPDNVSAVCTAQYLCTSPVRAGPEQIFFS